VRPRDASLGGIALAALSWLVLVFAGYGVERSACPGGAPAVSVAVAVASVLGGTLGLVLAIVAYRATASERSGDWLLGAAGLYGTVAAGAATVGGAVSLLALDLCSF